MATFLEPLGLPKLTGEENFLDSNIIREEFIEVIKALPTDKVLGPDCFNEEFF